MRETPRSLAMYFVLCGLFGLMGLLLFLLRLDTIFRYMGLLELLGCALYLFNGVVSAFMLYVGYNMSRLLTTRPELPLRLAKVSVLGSVLTFNILGILLNWYILANLKRLAKEAQVAPEQRVLR